MIQEEVYSRTELEEFSGSGKKSLTLVQRNETEEMVAYVMSHGKHLG
jgi:hypothetical protein